MTYICIILSITYIISVQINLVSRIYNSIKQVPKFYELLLEDNKLPKENRKQILGVILTYYLKTFLFIVLYVFIIIRMVLTTQEYVGQIHAYSLLFGILLSIYFVYHYSENFDNLDFNLAKYPLYIYIIFSILILFYFIFIPVLYHKIMSSPEMIEKFSNKYIEVTYMLPNDRGTNYNNKISNDNIIRSGSSTPGSSSSSSIRTVNNNTVNTIENKNIIENNFDPSTSKGKDDSSNNRNLYNKPETDKGLRLGAGSD